MIPTWEWVFLMFSVFYRVHDPKSDRGRRYRRILFAQAYGSRAAPVVMKV